jgi:diguanylate cyclase (GGDEF)-like protein
MNDRSHLLDDVPHPRWVGHGGGPLPAQPQLLTRARDDVGARLAWFSDAHPAGDFAIALARVALVAVAYGVVAFLSLRFALVVRQVTPIWPPTGIAVVALIVLGRRVWPGIAIGALLVNAAIGPTLLTAAAIAVGNTLAPLVVTTLLQSLDFRLQLDRLRDATALVVLGALGMTISATGGTTVLLLSHSIPASAYWSTWSVWWTGDTMGVLLIAPFLLSVRSYTWPTRIAWRRCLEFALLFAALAFVAHLVFMSRLQIEYLVFPLLVWSAVRLGQRGATPAALVVSGIAIWASVQETGPFAGETLMQKMVTLQVFNGSVAFASFVLAAVFAERDHGFVERRRVENELARKALHDPLTGLANRALFMERLGQALARSERHDGSVAVLFLDLDRFKVINDSLGHDVGDSVLVHVADLLRAALRPEDTASRFGGDEFVILCEDIESGGHAVTIATRLTQALGEPLALEAGEVVVTTSVGIATAKGTAESPEDVVRDADTAVYRAKERGRSRIEIFDHDMRVRTQGRLRTENELRRAIEQGRLRLHYQPLVVVGDHHRVHSVEALVRWEHPRHGLVGPEDFISVAEETGLIAPLGQWVLKEACLQAISLRAADPDGEVPSVAVNLSPRQLARPDFEEMVDMVLEETAVDASGLTFEITESVLVDAAPTVLGFLRRIRERGASLAIDDFGTGYSSLNYLKRFQVDMLKVDRSFVAGLGRDPDDFAIVAAVINLAHALGLTVAAEGVETREQLAQLRNLECDLAQGFLFARPAPAEALWGSARSVAFPLSTR